MAVSEAGIFVSSGSVYATLSGPLLLFANVGQNQELAEAAVPRHWLAIPAFTTLRSFLLIVFDEECYSLCPPH